MSDGAIRVIIVDDHPVFRDGLRSALSTAPDIEVVGEAADGREGIATFQEHAPDLVLMDLRMPRMEGTEAIAAILRLEPAARIIVLTTFDGDEHIHRALELGAKAYLLKDASRDDIVSAIRDVHAGKRPIPNEAASQPAELPIELGLTDREIQVLEGIASGLSNKEIGDELRIAEASVTAHVNEIVAKLEAKDRTDAAMIALKHGLIR